MDIKILREGTPVPQKAHPDDVGFDLIAAKIETLASGVIRVYTGVAVSPPSGLHFELVPRSSIYKKGLILANSIGIIDPNYIGEIIAHFYPAPGVKPQSPEDIIYVGEKVLQLILRPAMSHYNSFQVVSDLQKTDRGEGGFGSSGK